MCGRYNLTDSPLVQALLAQLGIDFEIEPRFNIAPTELVPVIVQQEDAFQVLPMRWWLVPRWSKGPSTQYAMFNARRESLHESRAYAKPFGEQRAILPASSFIEWQRDEQGKNPVLLETSQIPLALAALWEYWDSAEGMLLSCSIITREASQNFSAIHRRMPLVLQPEHYADWLNPRSTLERVDQILNSDGVPEIIATPVSRAVNNARNKAAGCITPSGDSWKILAE